MRELKFRAWDKKRNEWYGSDDPECLPYYDFHILGECTLLCSPLCEDLQHLEITQFTGLKDKNGTDIYEGDIVKRYNCEINEFGEVKYDGGYFYIDRKENVDNEYIQWPTEYFRDCEVIGNIYETQRQDVPHEEE